jgi:hypothetical protein
MAGRNRVGIFVPMRHDLFYEEAADPIGCGERGHKRWIFAAFQSGDVFGGAPSRVWHLKVASSPQHHKPPYIGPACFLRGGSTIVLFRYPPSRP